MSAPALSPAPRPASLPSAARDFDFLFGRWRIHNARLRHRLAASGDWDHFEASGECRPLLGGLGNSDSFDTDWNGGLRGMTLRLFNRASARWSLYWASDRDGVLEPPVEGGFDAGRGIFFGEARHEGRPVRLRFDWDARDPDAPRWQQAFSDGDDRWETNWIMQFQRVGH